MVSRLNFLSFTRSLPSSGDNKNLFQAASSYVENSGSKSKCISIISTSQPMFPMAFCDGSHDPGLSDQGRMSIFITIGGASFLYKEGLNGARAVSGHQDL